MFKKISFTAILLLCLIAFVACNGDSDDDDKGLLTINTNTLSIVDADGVVNTYTYGEGQTNFTELLPEGGTKQCFCQRLAFRSAQALMATEGFTALYPEGISKADIRIVTKWNTDGAEELFVDNLGWADYDVKIKLNATEHNYLTAEDAVFYFVPRDGDTAWKVSAQAKLFPPDFFTLRTAAKTGGDADISAFRPVKTDAMDNYLKPIPLEHAFRVEEIALSAEELEESLAVFAGWKGKWVSGASYLNDPAMEPAYDAVADLATGYTPDDVKDFMASMYRSEFGSMEINKETVTYYKTDAISGATHNVSCEYKPVGKVTVPWGEHQVEWHRFESVSEGAAEYAHLIATKVHSHDGDLSHWHLRYGSSSFENLINYADPMWWPTAFADGSPALAIADDMLGEADEFAMMLPSLDSSENIGVMVIAHGSDETEWNQAVAEAVDDVELPYPTALGFLEFHDQDIGTAAKSLEQQNVNKIIAVPLFICSYSNHIEEIRYVLGLRDALPEEDADSGHEDEHEEEELIPIDTDTEIILTPALDDNSAVADILAGHLGDIIQQPEQEIAVLVGHGGDSPECLEKWNQNFSSLASQVKNKLGLKDARYGFVAMGEPAVADVVSAAQEEGNVLVVPVMLSRGYFIQTKIPQALEGLEYSYADKALLPDPAIATLIENRVKEVIPPVD
ncbi:sirohydrochlorin chelatase [Desulfonema magnum]|uniref:Cobalamin biosynthesis protein domain-containing protein n=1 Tax=Desulfonema magnum TaxID=45655 RepID=A0A975BKD8_9BACT|nr:CbiX/SirB N-terminal domain-containing protein [Desulfonema magnum]QTA87008.1 Cobalamin biosynthesis protein domain-containing protein [Desulfonema magnum]